MHSLSQLNAFNSNDLLNRTDERPTGIVFTDTHRTGPDNQIITISSTVATVNRPGIEIDEVVNYQSANVVYTIEIWSGFAPYLTGSTITWSNRSSWPYYMSLTTTTNAAGFTVYTITGIVSGKDWSYVRAFLWNLPSDYATKPNWRLNHTITWYNGATGLTDRVDWITGDARFMSLSDMTAKSTLTCTTRVDYKPTIALSSAFTLYSYNDPMVFTISLNTQYTTLYLVIAGSGLIFDWGNGNGKDYTYYDKTLTWYPNTSGSTDLTSGSVSTGATQYTGISCYHVYGYGSGTRTIKVWGNITRFNGVQGVSATTAFSTSYYDINSISSWGDSKITNLDYALLNQFQMQNVCLPTNIPKTVTSVKGMFKFSRTNSGGGSASIPLADYALGQWDVQNIQNFQDMFRGSATYLASFSPGNQLSSWWTKSATNMNGMFYQMLQTVFLNDLSSWDVHLISTYPTNFASPLPTALPVWGTYGSH